MLSYNCASITPSGPDEPARAAAADPRHRAGLAQRQPDPVARPGGQRAGRYRVRYACTEHARARAGVPDWRACGPARQHSLPQRSHGVQRRCTASLRLPHLIPEDDAPSIRDWDLRALWIDYTGQQAERFAFDGVLTTGQTHRWGDLDWQVIAAPGHDAGALVFWNEDERIRSPGMRCGSVASAWCCRSRQARWMTRSARWKPWWR